jgi:hypothetical protein
MTAFRPLCDGDCLARAALCHTLAAAKLSCAWPLGMSPATHPLARLAAGGPLWVRLGGSAVSAELVLAIHATLA